MTSNTDGHWELTTDDDIPMHLWSGDGPPSAIEINNAAGLATSRGWKGTELELYREGKFYDWVTPDDPANLA